ncbi:zinc ABC transporter substrate-binding protein [Streptomyces sp. TRM66268-LWL]|uniref:Zinc ABC transporter substrate-binding protein n=1 Tax=Streptomyces polyasparticus TaxID=2767826 RepID=A0ABR7SNT3_9ACTN|nr:metal ABC transporter substrate-binding protein [Streptomyces polyasparticus]MBC9716171.1 zinc ABC transporter substrate-binding protein [Streptomyces polyasparticus]
MNVRRPSRLISTAALAGASTLGLLALSACGSSNAADGKSDGKLDVVASFYPMQYLAEEIGGDHVNVDTLTKPGVEPHDLELSPKQTVELGNADMILYLKDLQPAVDKAIDQSGVKTVVDAAGLTKLEKHGSSEDHEGHDHEGEDAHADEHAEDEHGHSHESEAGEDPHIWLDPVKYAEVANGVGDALAKADPDHAADYKKNTEALVGKLEALNKDFADGLKNTTTKTFITTHAAFGYLAERYGLDQEAISGLSPEAEPSPARIKELQETAEHDKVSTVFFETLASDKTAKTLAKDTGLKTDVLDPLEGITDKSKGADYLEVMQSNLTALKSALGAK